MSEPTERPRGSREKGRNRRPDQAVYVPRGRRMANNIEQEAEMNGSLHNESSLSSQSQRTLEQGDPSVESPKSDKSPQSSPATKVRRGGKGRGVLVDRTPAKEGVPHPTIETNRADGSEGENRVKVPRGRGRGRGVLRNMERSVPGERATSRVESQDVSKGGRRQVCAEHTASAFSHPDGSDTPMEVDSKPSTTDCLPARSEFNESVTAPQQLQNASTPLDNPQQVNVQRRVQTSCPPLDTSVRSVTPPKQLEALQELIPSELRHISQGTSEQPHISQGTSEQPHISQGTSEQPHISQGIGDVTAKNTPVPVESVVQPDDTRAIVNIVIVDDIQNKDRAGSSAVVMPMEFDTNISNAVDTSEELGTPFSSAVDIPTEFDTAMADAVIIPVELSTELSNAVKMPAELDTNTSDILEMPEHLGTSARDEYRVYSVESVTGVAQSCAEMPSKILVNADSFNEDSEEHQKDITKHTLAKNLPDVCADVEESDTATVEMNLPVQSVVELDSQTTIVKDLTFNQGSAQHMDAVMSDPPCVELSVESSTLSPGSPSMEAENDSSNSGLEKSPELTLGSESTVQETSTEAKCEGETCAMTDAVTCDVTCDVTGAVAGDVTCDVTGDVTDDVTDAMTGDVTGAVTNAMTGDVTGAVTCDMISPPGSTEKCEPLAGKGGAAPLGIASKPPLVSSKTADSSSSQVSGPAPDISSPKSSSTKKVKKTKKDAKKESKKEKVVDRSSPEDLVNLEDLLGSSADVLRRDTGSSSYPKKKSSKSSKIRESTAAEITASTISVEKPTKRKATNVDTKSSSTRNKPVAAIWAGENLDKNDKMEEDEDASWDAMFDNEGDCVDPDVMAELNEKVGKVTIVKPTIDYLKYTPKEVSIEPGRHTHLIEIYDFPPSFKTPDLIGIFSEFMSRGFDLKWVDDTHAIGIFASTAMASQALQMGTLMMKMRPIHEASQATKSKVQNCKEFLQPYKARPVTTSLAAHRLVAGALGIATNTPVDREARRKERLKLQEAKDKKKLDKKLERDIWEGE